LGRARRCLTTTQQSPHWLQWDAQIHPQNCLFPFDDHRPRLIHPSLDPTHHRKRHPDPISRFATIHFPDTQTNRSHRWDRRQLDCINAYALYIDRERRAKKITDTPVVRDYSSNFWNRVLAAALFYSPCSSPFILVLSLSLPITVRRRCYCVSSEITTQCSVRPSVQSMFYHGANLMFLSVHLLTGVFFSLQLAICRPSGCTAVSGFVVVVVGVCNRSQMRPSKCTCLIFGVSIGLEWLETHKMNFDRSEFKVTCDISPTISGWLLVVICICCLCMCVSYTFAACF